MTLTDLANPSRFLALTDRVLPWLAAATLVAFAFGISQAYLAPDDYQQGATVKIMFIHVPAAWLGTLRLDIDEHCRPRHAGLAPSARRRRRQGRGADRRRLHADVPRDRLALGPADVGHLLGVGRAADLGAGPVPDVSRRDRAVADGRGPDARGAGGGGAHPRRRDQHPDHQVFRRLVEHAAPARVGAAPGRLDDPSDSSSCRC